MMRIQYYKGKIPVVQRSKISKMGSAIYEFLADGTFDHGVRFGGARHYKKGERDVCLAGDVW